MAMRRCMAMVARRDCRCSGSRPRQHAPATAQEHGTRQKDRVVNHGAGTETRRIPPIYGITSMFVFILPDSLGPNH
jgi:hypothetical protein